MIENNIRSTIVRRQLIDPAYFEKMSTLLAEIITARKARAIEYEEFLRRIADLARQVEAGHEENIPEALRRSPAIRALYNNLKQRIASPPTSGNISEFSPPFVIQGDPSLALAIRIDETVRRVRPHGFRGNQAKENAIKAALLPLLGEIENVERVFQIIKAQTEY